MLQKKYLIKILFLSFVISVLFNQNLISRDNLYNSNDIFRSDYQILKQYPKKAWTIMVYIAADNDLSIFAWQNIKQMAQAANKNSHIIVQLNEPGQNKKTQRYLIDKNKAYLLNKENKEKLDSGNPQTVIDFCTWTKNTFPADHYMAIFSNHGSGIIDYGRGLVKLINHAEYFTLNPSTLMLELDRSIEFLDTLEALENKMNLDKHENPVLPKSKEDEEPKGVCYDETHQSYLTNQKLEQALKAICQNDFKFSILGFDACLMQMTEIANLAKPYADILVGSQEVELGPGWEYSKMLRPLETSILNPIDFAKHIVHSYAETYANVTNEFTLSAINLNIMNALENNLNEVAQILIECLVNQTNHSVKTIMNSCKNSIGFEEPSYIDLITFYQNLKNNIPKMALRDKNIELKNKLNNALTNGLNILKNIIIENSHGSKIAYAQGISIYLPEKKVHQSYAKTNFAKNNHWFNLISNYIGR